MNSNIKYCELDPGKICDGCGKCNICDLDPNKICDSCGKCLGIDGVDYKEILIDGVVADKAEIDDHLYDEVKSKDNECNIPKDSDLEYIEDNPELKKKYERKLNEYLFQKSRKNKPGR